MHSTSQYMEVYFTYRSLNQEFDKIQIVIIDPDVPFLTLYHTTVTYKNACTNDNIECFFPFLIFFFSFRESKLSPN